MTGQWELFVTDQLGQRQAQIDVYQHLEAVGRINDVSTWSLVLPTATDAGRYFTSQTFARLEIVLDASVWRSGPLTKYERQRASDGDTLTVSGVDDTVWLGRRLAHPQPNPLGPPQAEDVRSGSVSEVLAAYVNANAGPGAAAGRAVPGLTIAPPAPGLAGINATARFQNLLTLLQDTARPWRVLFRVVDLAFVTEVSQNRGAIFSEGLETLGGWTLTAEAPTANQVTVAGGGEGVDRILRESIDLTSAGAWGRIESFVDQRQTVDVAQLDKAASEAIAAGAKPVTVKFLPLDSEGQAFSRDWNLGDTVTVMAGDLKVVDQIRELHVTLDDHGATLVPSVGQAAGDLTLFRQLAALDRRLRQLERI
jgi:hypothetical protein